MMICRECGAKIDDGSLECKYCGAVYGSAQPQEPEEAVAEPIVEETYGVAAETDGIEELFDENEAKRQIQIERIREEKQAQLEEIEKRRKIKKRRQRRNRVLVVLLILLCGVAVAAGVYYTGSTLGNDDSDHAVVVTPNPTQKSDKPVNTPKATKEPRETQSPEPEVTPEPEITPEPEVTPEPGTVDETESVVVATPKPVSTPRPVVTSRPVATPKPVSTPRPVTSQSGVKSTLTSARITGGEVIKADGKTYMSFIYNNKWYYAKVSDNTTTNFIAWKQMTVNAYTKGEIYRGVPVYTITKITHHDNPQSNASQPTSSQPVVSVQNGSYIFPNSATQLLTTADLQGKTAYQLRIARNEIYARHGRTFKDTALQNHFNSCSWYSVNNNYNYSNDNANLNAVEKKNIMIIKNYENGL